MTKTIHNIVIYHYPCPDGELSAAVFKDHLVTDNNTHFVPWMHENKVENQALSIQELIKYKNSVNKPYIYFLDYCPEFEFVMEIISNISKVIILDHHQSACETFQDNLSQSNDSQLDKIEFIFKNNMSGCMITWEYFHQNTYFPKPLQYIGKRDIWVWDDPDIEPFTSGYHHYCNINNNIEWYERVEIFRNLLNANSYEINRIIEFGNNNLQRMREEAKELCKEISFSSDTDIEGTMLKIINVPMTKHHLTKYVQEEIMETFNNDYDILRLGYFKQDKKVYSLRSLKDDIRVDLLAQKYGGNGHMKASGYSLPL